MKLYNPAFRRVLHKRQIPSAYEIELLNRVDELERLAFGEENYTSFRLRLRSYAEKEEGGCRLTEKERLRLLQHRISELKSILIKQGKGFEIEKLDKANTEANIQHHAERWIVKKEGTENKK